MVPTALPRFLPEPPDSLPPLDLPLTEHDELGVREQLRRQIARMEAELGRLFGAAFPRRGIEWRVAAPAAGGPRILGVAELEEVRDDLADRLAEARDTLGEISEYEEAHRELLERMVADPAAYRWLRIPGEAMGEPSCRTWHVRPRWGVVGFLMNWWRVKVSSGCPLARRHGPGRGAT
jgi:hypothetical protein